MIARNSGSLPNEYGIKITLDGCAVELPASRRTLVAIHAYLEIIVMERQRILLSLAVDGQPTHFTQFSRIKVFSCVEAQSIELDDLPLQLIRTAREQINLARDHVQSAVTRVLINPGEVAQEFWWQLAHELKEPLLTLSLLPNDICGPANGRVSLTQLRKWQLQQLATIIQNVDATCESGDTLALSNILESRVLPWLENLRDLVCLWEETAAAGARLTNACAA